MKVFEEPQHNQFECVWSFKCPGDPLFSGFAVVTGDLDGDGTDEFAVSSDYEIRIFHCYGPDNYQQVAQIDRANVTRMRCFDINGDGRVELIFRHDSMYIYEDTVGLSAISQYTNSYCPSLPKAQPSISIRGAPVLFTDIVAGSTVTISNSSGVVIRSEPVITQRQWRWNLIDNQGRPVPTGTYFAAIRGRGQSSRVKLCIVK